MNVRLTTTAALGALALVAGSATQAAAQTTSLLPWVGCWEAEGAPTDAALCVRPTGDAGSVEILRVEDGAIAAREVLWADGQRHETVREECEGWESGTFSADGRRVFLQSEHACEDGTVRKGAGVMALTGGDQWLDVRTLEVAGEPTAWVQRYGRSYGEAAELVGVADLLAERAMTVRAARAAAGAELDLDDVLEASAILPAEAVEAWLAETGDGFDVDAESLIAMDDAGVSDRVIDVVVALSNPGTFRLADGGAMRVEGEDDGRGVRRGYGNAWGGSFFWDPFGYRRYRYSPYSAYGYGYGYGGYGSGYYGYGYGYRPTIVVIEPRQQDSGGRVVNGRGYTRRSGSSSPAPRPASGSTMSRPSTGGSSSASPSRGSTGSSSGSTRKAKPRGGKGPGGF